MRSSRMKSIVLASLLVAMLAAQARALSSTGEMLVKLGGGLVGSLVGAATGRRRHRGTHAAVRNPRSTRRRRCWLAHGLQWIGRRRRRPRRRAMGGLRWKRRRMPPRRTRRRLPQRLHRANRLHARCVGARRRVPRLRDASRASNRRRDARLQPLNESRVLPPATSRPMPQRERRSSSGMTI